MIACIIKIPRSPRTRFVGRRSGFLGNIKRLPLVAKLDLDGAVTLATEQAELLPGIPLASVPDHVGNGFTHRDSDLFTLLGVETRLREKLLDDAARQSKPPRIAGKDHFDFFSHRSTREDSAVRDHFPAEL